MELYKLYAGGKKLEDYRNTFLNLAVPIFSQGEPIKPATKKYLGMLSFFYRVPSVALNYLIIADKSFTLWDRIDIKIGDATLQEVISFFEKKHKITIDMLGVGQSLLYASWSGAKAKERLPKKITALYEEITKSTIDREHVKFLMLEPTATDENGDDIKDLPHVAFWFSKKE